MNRTFRALLMAAAVAWCPAGAELQTTSRTTAEAAFHYDENILLPDSITGRPSFKHELIVTSQWYLQLTKLQMLRLGLNFWNEQLTSFPNEDIHTFGADLQYRNFLSRKVMVNADARYHYQFSPSEFYRSDYLLASVLAGYYFNPACYGQAKYEGGYKRFPEYLRYDLAAGNGKSYDSNSYWQQKLGVYGRYRLSPSWTVYIDNEADYNNYYHDRYDLDQLDSTIGYSGVAQAPFADYVQVYALASRDSLDSLGNIVTVYDTTYYYGTRNIQQQDVYGRAKAGCTFNFRNKMLSEVAGSYRAHYSTDPYYRYQGAALDASGQWHRPAFTLKMYYQLLLKYYTSRYTDATLTERQRDIVHFLRLGVTRPILPDLFLEFQYTHTVLFSNYAGDEYQKNIFTVLMRYKK